MGVGLILRIVKRTHALTAWIIDADSFLSPLGCGSPATLKTRIWCNT